MLYIDGMLCLLKSSGVSKVSSLLRFHNTSDCCQVVSCTALNLGHTSMIIHLITIHLSLITSTMEPSDKGQLHAKDTCPASIM